jgi:hypothetical protein
MMLRLLVSVLLIAACAAPGSAQVRPNRALTRLDAVALPPGSAPRSDTTQVPAAALRGTRAGRTAERGLHAALGWVGGGVAGALLNALLKGPHPGDVEEQAWLLAGSIVAGATAGAGLGAAAPSFGQQCSFSRRAGNGLLGSLAGGAAGALLSTRQGESDLGVVLLPLGSSVGAALTAGC